MNETKIPLNFPLFSFYSLRTWLPSAKIYFTFKIKCRIWRFDREN